jgi:hypothetical protein
MQVGAFYDGFNEKGLVICGLPEKISRKTILFMPMLVVRIVDVSRHPLFWLHLGYCCSEHPHFFKKKKQVLGVFGKAI